MATEPVSKPLAVLLTKRRTDLGITLETMEARLRERRLTASKSSLARWEHGEATPLEAYLPAIANAYRLPRATVRQAWLAQRVT